MANTGSPAESEKHAETSGRGFLDRLALAIQKRREPGSWLGRFLRLLSLAHLGLQLGFLLVLAGVMVGMSRLGEQNLATAFFLFLPPYIWLFPLVLLFPLALLTPHRWVCVPQLLLTLYLLGPYMGWRWNYPAVKASDKPVLKVMTNNWGQKGDVSMSGFIEANDPDVLLFQEARNRARNYLKGYPQYTFGESENEFSMVSKLPILETTSLRLDRADSGEGGQITAVRSVIEFAGRPVALYNVHMPTPRGALRSLRGPALLHGIIQLPGTREGRDDHMRYWNQKVRLTHELRTVLEGETLPYLVAGDFNMPHLGYLYGTFIKTGGGLTDAHRAAGKGYGHTFPGTTNNLLSLGGPWLRIDYVFASRHWKVRRCVTERDRPSQHRAVTAELTLEEN